LENPNKRTFSSTKAFIISFLWKNVTFWMKTIGKNLDFLKCDILPISDITKLREKKNNNG